VLRPGDVLFVEGPPEQIINVKDFAGVEIKADVKLSDPDLTDDKTVLVEAILLPRGPPGPLVLS
jgi:hypothetical protein